MKYGKREESYLNKILACQSHNQYELLKKEIRSKKSGKVLSNWEKIFSDVETKAQKLAEEVSKLVKEFKKTEEFQKMKFVAFFLSTHAEVQKYYNKDGSYQIGKSAIGNGIWTVFEDSWGIYENMTGNHALIRDLFYQHLKENDWLPEDENNPYYLAYNKEINERYYEYYDYWDKPLKYAGIKEEDLNFIKRFGNKK